MSLRQPDAARRTRGRVAAAALLATVLVAACSDSNDAAPAATDPATSTTEGRVDDGALVIGAVLPTVGPASEIGVSMTTALTVGVTEINQAGGVGGRPVRLVLREEGDNSATAVLAVQSLLQARVDAIIGPTSSLDLLATLGEAVDNGVLTCAPTASALALDSYPDNGLFFRTVPSDSLQASAMARLVETSGSSTAAVVYLDDAYGRPFAEATRSAITGEGTAVSAFVGFTAGDTSITEAVDEIVAARPDVIAVVADATTGPAIIAAIDAASNQSITFVVNDAVRRPAASAQPFDADLSSRVVGASPLAHANSVSFLEALTEEDPDSTGLFAHNAYDCLAIIALAAQAAGSGVPAEMALEIPAATSSGTRCFTYAECSTALAEGRNINYDGPGGNLAINPSGEMTSAVFERFTFDENSRDVSTGTLRIGDG